MFCNLMKAMTITIIAMWAIEVTAAPQTTGGAGDLSCSTELVSGDL